MSGSKKVKLSQQGPVKRTRRANHEGTLEKLPSGKWRCYAWVDKKKVSGKPAWTKTDATRNLRDRLSAVREGVSALSLSSLARQWLKAQKYAPNTVETYEYWITEMERDLLGQLPVVKITDRRLKEWKL